MNLRMIPVKVLYVINNKFSYTTSVLVQNTLFLILGARHIVTRMNISV